MINAVDIMTGKFNYCRERTKISYEATTCMTCLKSYMTILWCCFGFGS